MNNIKFQSKYEYNIEYLPTRRSRKHRKQTLETTTDFEVKNLLSIEAPVAFKIHDFNDSYAQAQGKSLSDNLYVVYPVRFYKGRFYKEYIKQNIDKKIFAFVDGTNNIAKEVKHLTYPLMQEEVAETYYPDIPFNPMKSIKFSELGNMDNRKNEIQKQINKEFIVVENRLYVETSGFGTGEPRYAIYTFGLGHNHGGTSLSIDFSYNGNISKNRYFRADEYEQAIAKVIDIALNRGDTESVKMIKKDHESKRSNYIEIIDSSAVQLHPSEEAGDGDPFMNEIESLINGSPDTLTAGLGVIAATANQINKN